MDTETVKEIVVRRVNEVKRVLGEPVITEADLGGVPSHCNACLLASAMPDELKRAEDRSVTFRSIHGAREAASAWGTSASECIVFLPDDLLEATEFFDTGQAPALIDWDEVEERGWTDAIKEKLATWERRERSRADVPS